MSIPELEVNEPVVLEFLGTLPPDYEDAEAHTSIEGTVTSLTRNTIQVELHRPFKAVLALQSGDPFRISYSDPGRIYIAETNLVEARGFVRTRLLLRRPPRFQPAQRRRFFRAAAAVPLSYSVVRREVTEGVPDTVSYTARALDISSGGVRFESPVALPPGTRLRVTFMPPGDIRKVEATAQVVRSIHRQTAPPYEVAVELTEINEHDRDFLMRCLFRWQAELRKLQETEK